MRSGFGRLSEELRSRRGMTQTEFAEKTGMSLSRVSNLECQRTNISDDLVSTYIRVLDCDGIEADELRKRANFSNGIRKRTSPHSVTPSLEVMLEQFGDKLSNSAIQKIQKIIERETGEQLEVLAFSSNLGKPTASRRATKSRILRPSLSPKRFAEIAVGTLDLRRTFCADMHKLQIETALQKTATSDERFDYVILETMPKQFLGAFACIVGHQEGHTIVLEEKRYSNAVNGVHFARHVVFHEMAHHFLHSSLLESDSRTYFRPQNLAMNSPDMMDTPLKIEQVVDNIEEVEAECFSTLLMVPWEVYLKGTEMRYIAQDYGEQQKEIERYAPYFKNRAVLDALREILWRRDERRHPIFEID